MVGAYAVSGPLSFGGGRTRQAARRSGGCSPSALIYPDFYLIIAWFAEHFIAFAFFDVPLPFLIWHAEHFRPKFTALGTHIWIHDEWDTALIIQRTFPLVCTENSIRIDWGGNHVTSAHNDRAVMVLANVVRFAVEVEEPS